MQITREVVIERGESRTHADAEGLASQSGMSFEQSLAPVAHPRYLLGSLQHAQSTFSDALGRYIEL